MKKQACKSCKLFYDGEECPACRSSQTVTNWKGRLEVFDVAKSEIAQKVGIKRAGEYAIKVN